MLELDPRHRQHIFEGEPDEDLILALEPDQLVEAMDAHLPRRPIGRWTWFGLWVLRLYVLALTAMAVYAFVVRVVEQ
jgi:hypothetical protein